MEFSGEKNLLSVKQLGKHFDVDRGAVVSVLDNISLTVRSGEFLSIVGPSGCGKTTLLKIVAGLLRPTVGEVFFEQRAVSGPPMNAVYLSQQYTKSLFPWRTILRNVEFALESRNVGRRERVTRAKESLAGVGLDGVYDRYPWQLSGGMQQRATIARALVARPRLLLMDEPFSSVDAMTRMDLQDVTLRVWHEFQLTVILVTHDIEEAVYLSDRVVVMAGQPARVIEKLTVDLPRPRDQLRTREAPRFIELRRHLYELVRRRSESENERTH
jgi:NitT/TauT family transport system ATP-binding protein